MSDDAEFDAFLKREGALSRRLNALPQAEPGAALDAAVLQRARALMAQESARPVAANDGADGRAAPTMPRLGWRWRVPAGIAATVLAGVFAHQAYQASADLKAGAPMPEPAQEAAPVQEQKAAAPAPAPPVSEQVRKRAPAPQRKQAPAAPAMVEDKATPAAVGAMAGYAPPPPPPPAPAPAAMATAPLTLVERRQTEQSSRMQVSGSRVSEALDAMPPAQWLAAIEAMLESGKAGDAAFAWRQFRQAYPDYPVPQTTQDKIDALQK